MFTDMVGYTAMGQKNEVLSLALVEEQRKLIRPILSRHDGREVKTIGDAFLVEFPNAVDAVRCAYDIQRAIREFNLSLASDKRIHLRIGVHVGEVVESQGDITGDAVNLASRIEPIAEDGGVCLTRQVYDHVKNKIDLPLSSLGLKSLKNVTEPIEVYKLVMPWNVEKAVLSTELDKKRVAILPFANMSPDPNDAYFADGMTEELISTMSKIGELRVISRTSIMQFKEKSKSVTEIAKELNAGTILEGSVRKAGSRIRVTIQMVDAAKDTHLWAESYDRDLQDIFAIQSEIAMRASGSLKVRLLSGEKSDIEKIQTENTEAYQLYLKGRHFWNERTREAVDKAARYFEEALKLDSKYALANAGLGDCYIIRGAFGWLEPDDSFPKARQYAMKSIEMDPRLAEAHTILAGVFDSYEGKWQDAVYEYKRALELKPSYATAHMWYGLLLLFLGRFADARNQIELSVKLDPFSRVGRLNLSNVSYYQCKSQEAIEQIQSAFEADPDYAYNHNALGWAYYLGSRTEEAITEMRQAVSLSGGDPILKADLACALGFSGHSDEARRLLEELVAPGGAPNYVSKMKIAQVLFSLGRADEAFSILEEAREDHSMFTQVSSYLLDIRVLPWFAKVREDPRWNALVRRLKIPET
jgi:adenylate cyclase